MISFNGNFSGLKNRFTFEKVALTEQWRRATTSATHSPPPPPPEPCYGRQPWMVSFSSYIGKGHSNLKERPKSNPRVNQNKTRMSNYGRKLCTVRMSNYRLEALYSQQARKKVFSIFYTPYAPTPSTPKHQPQNVGHLLFIKDNWNFLIIYALWHPEWPAISLGEASLHSNTLISLSKARGLQLQWSKFKHIEGKFVYLCGDNL